MSLASVKPGRTRVLATIALTATLGLTACGGSGSSETGDADAAADGQWPLTITDDAGHEVTIDKAPESIVSTSVTLTGSLLAVDAPVTASGATMPNSPVADDKGFFTQWSDVAAEKKVEALYQGDPDVEAVLAEEPDLIVVSKTGQDSASAIYDRRDHRPRGRCEEGQRRIRYAGAGGQGFDRCSRTAGHRDGLQ